MKIGRILFLWISILLISSSVIIPFFPKVYADFLFDNNQTGCTNDDYIYDTNYVAQTFNSTVTFMITTVGIYVRNYSAPNPLTISLEFTGIDGKPNGTVIRSAQVVNTTLVVQWCNATFSSSYKIVQNVSYAIVCSTIGGSDTPTHEYMWKVSLSGVYPRGMVYDSYNSGVSWEGFGNEDASFQLFGDSIVVGGVFDEPINNIGILAQLISILILLFMLGIVLNFSGADREAKEIVAALLIIVIALWFLSTFNHI